MHDYSALSTRDINQPLSAAAGGKEQASSSSKTKLAAAATSRPGYFARMNSDENKSTSGTYRSPSDVASPISQKISAMKTRRMNKSNLKQRSLFASTVSNQHTLKTTLNGTSSTNDGGANTMAVDDDGNSSAGESSSASTASSMSGTGRGMLSAGSQSEGSMADDELDAGLSDKSDDTIVIRRGGVEDGDGTGRGRRRGGRSGEINAEEKQLDDGYLADESERN